MEQFEQKKQSPLVVIGLTVILVVMAGMLFIYLQTLWQNSKQPNETAAITPPEETLSKRERALAELERLASVEREGLLSEEERSARLETMQSGNTASSSADEERRVQAMEKLTSLKNSDTPPETNE